MAEQYSDEMHRKAKVYYAKEGKNLHDISELLGVPEVTLGNWKKAEDWDRFRGELQAGSYDTVKSVKDVGESEEKDAIREYQLATATLDATYDVIAIIKQALADYRLALDLESDKGEAVDFQHPLKDLIDSLGVANITQLTVCIKDLINTAGSGMDMRDRVRTKIIAMLEKMERSDKGSEARKLIDPEKIKGLDDDGRKLINTVRELAPTSAPGKGS